MTHSNPPRIVALPAESPSLREAPAMAFDQPNAATVRIAGRTETAWPERNLQRQAEQLAEGFVDNLLRCAHVLRGALSEELNEFGLSDVRCSVLGFLKDRGSRGSSQRALARELCQSESSISTLVDRMAADGLLKREPAPGDRRRRVLTLTDSGRQMLESVSQVRGRRCRGMVKKFNDSELERCNVVLSTLADYLANRAAEVSLLGSGYSHRRAA